LDGTTLALNDMLPRVLELCANECHQIAIKMILCTTGQMTVSDVLRTADPGLFGAPLDLQIMLLSALASSKLPQTTLEMAELAGTILGRELIVTEQAEAVALAKEIKTAKQLAKLLKELVPDAKERDTIETELKAIEVRRYFRRRFDPGLSSTRSNLYHSHRRANCLMLL
jgi:hypothetical protein